MSQILRFPVPEASHPSPQNRVKREPTRKDEAAPDLWTRPVDLGPCMLLRLLHGLAEVHRRRLKVFARKGQHVSARDLLAVNGESDLRALSCFYCVVTRRLRGLFDDQENKIHLIGWDFAKTRWGDGHAKIVDGECYVSEVTHGSLVQCLGHLPDRSLREVDGGCLASLRAPPGFIRFPW